MEAPAVKGIANEPNKAIAAPPIIAARLRLRLLRNGFDLSGVTAAYGMFQGCVALTTIVCNGVMYILRGGKTYSVQGMVVR